MADWTIVVANKNYSSWSLRGWLALKQTGVAFEEVVIPLDEPTTREQILRQTHQEVPHHASVETETWTEKPDGSVRIDCTIYIARATQKAILIGDKGGRIREIGRLARLELIKLLERPVHLFLNVKEKANWDEQAARIRAIGLEDAG